MATKSIDKKKTLEYAVAFIANTSYLMLLKWEYHKCETGCSLYVLGMIWA